MLQVMLIDTCRRIIFYIITVLITNIIYRVIKSKLIEYFKYSNKPDKILIFQVKKKTKQTPETSVQLKRVTRTRGLKKKVIHYSRIRHQRVV